MSRLLEDAVSMLLSGTIKQGPLDYDGPHPYCAVKSITPVPFELQLNRVVIECDHDGEWIERTFLCTDMVTSEGDTLPLIRQEIQE